MWVRPLAEEMDPAAVDAGLSQGGHTRPRPPAGLKGLGQRKRVRKAAVSPAQLHQAPHTGHPGLGHVSLSLS